MLQNLEKKQDFDTKELECRLEIERHEEHNQIARDKLVVLRKAKFN